MSAWRKYQWQADPPFIINGLDNEAKCRTDGIDILVHDPLYDGCLACVVKASATVCQQTAKV